jgi:hypothetical protein
MRLLGAVVVATLMNLTGCGYQFGSSVHATGPLDRRFVMTSFGGDIDVEDAMKGAQVRSFGGSVHIGASSGRVVATSYGGSIDVDSLRSDATLRSYGGPVEVHLAAGVPGARRTVSIMSYGGDVILHVPHDFTGSIDLRVHSRPSRIGDYEIESDLPLTESTRGVRGPAMLFQPRAERRKVGYIGEGGDRIVVRTEEGNVRLVSS